MRKGSEEAERKWTRLGCAKSRSEWKDCQREWIEMEVGGMSEEAEERSGRGWKWMGLWSEWKSCQRN
ncbi:hypothetical protein E2C01_079187 [Portunus trituberculatus]|uniref:Uncharacterized protein n=1 Tax=Portunus trituberculatus TaxID=210409 RepID=A0A5B7IQS8_PORTR|nr:hypothetical protein [Portunus trituberculatus]